MSPPASLEANALIGLPESLLLNSKDRILTIALEGVARNMPVLDESRYDRFYQTVRKQALETSDHAPDADKHSSVLRVIHEFEKYKQMSESDLRARQHEWRILAGTLLRELEERLGFDASSLELRIGELESTEELKDFREELTSFLHPTFNPEDGNAVLGFGGTDRSEDNHNLAGLRGGGAAVAHVRRLMERNRSCYVAQIRLGALDMINERFGEEAVGDCLMAVSSYLTASLHREDMVYHWTDSMLLVVLEDRATEKLARMELERIIAQNREITVNLHGRLVMLRIPLEFVLTPTRALAAPEEIYKLTMSRDVSLS